LTIDRWLLKGAALGVRINEGGIEHVTASRFEVRRASMIPNNIRLFERYIPSPPAYPVPANNQIPSVTGQKSTVNGQKSSWLLKGAALGVRLNEGGIEHVHRFAF